MGGLGALYAAYGPVIPELQRQYGVSEGSAGYPLAIQSVGAVVGVLAVHLLLRRWGNRVALGSAAILMIVGAALVAATHAWVALLAGALVAGLGLGAFDSQISQLLVIGNGTRGPVLLNVAHGCFGLGTVAAPAIVAVVGAERYRLLFAVIALVVAAGAASLRSVSPRPTPADRPHGHGSPGLRTGALYVALGFLVLYVAHFAVQSGIGSWEPTRLADQGHDGSAASLATSGYWLAMVLGRFAASPLIPRMGPRRIVVGSCFGMTGALVLAVAVPNSTIWIYLLVGLFIGPIFPNGLAWLQTSGYATGGIFSAVVAGAMAGAIALPPVLGALIEAHGTSILAPALLVVAALSIAATLVTSILAKAFHDSR